MNKSIMIEFHVKGFSKWCPKITKYNFFSISPPMVRLGIWSVTSLFTLIYIVNRGVLGTCIKSLSLSEMCIKIEKITLLPTLLVQFHQKQIEYWACRGPKSPGSFTQTYRQLLIDILLLHESGFPQFETDVDT